MKNTKATTTTAAYELISFRVATRMADEGYPLDYDVRCPDGTVLCFANEGGGGPDYLKATKVGRKYVAATRDDDARMRDLELWCAMQQPDRAAQIKAREERGFARCHNGHKLPAPTKAQPWPRCEVKDPKGIKGVCGHSEQYGDKPTTEDIGIWAEDLGNEMQVQKTIARKIKRTVCYRMPGSYDLGYYTVRRGEVMTDDTRRRLAAKIRKEKPGAIVYGGADGLDGAEPIAVAGYNAPAKKLGGMTRTSLIAWLTQNDANGCYTDEDCDAENFPRLTLESAHALYVEQNDKVTETPAGTATEVPLECAECGEIHSNTAMERSGGKCPTRPADAKGVCWNCEEVRPDIRGNKVVCDECVGEATASCDGLKTMAQVRRYLNAQVKAKRGTN